MNTDPFNKKFALERDFIQNWGRCILEDVDFGSLKEMAPSVSVVMTVRNVEKYIANCIMSLLDQTFNEFEIVIIDDMSNDNTKNIIEKFDDNWG